MVYGVRLPVSDTGNFLGWTRDPKLTWNAHLTASFVRRDGGAPGRIISSNWEMKPHMAHWLNICWWWFVLRYSLVVHSYSDSAASSSRVARIQSILYIT